MVQLHFQPARPGARARVAGRNDLLGRHDGQRPSGRLGQTGRQGPYLVHGVRAHGSELYGTAVPETPAGRHPGGGGDQTGGFQAAREISMRSSHPAPDCAADGPTNSLMKKRIHMRQIARSFAWFTVAVVFTLGRAAAAPASEPGFACVIVKSQSAPVQFAASEIILALKQVGWTVSSEPSAEGLTLTLTE